MLFNIDNDLFVEKPSVTGFVTTAFSCLLCCNVILHLIGSYLTLKKPIKVKLKCFDGLDYYPEKVCACYTGRSLLSEALTFFAGNLSTQRN